MEKNRKEKNQNIQVFVRLRPLNQREHDIRSLGVVEVCSHREVLVRQVQAPTITKKFTFDRAFGPSSKQEEVYQTVVSPLIEEVLAGYNCTVFAYGQTGTGKTHTMVGETSDHKGSRQNDPMAGIIPRSLGQLFDELRISNAEFTVRVSYLELYNEELFDLLAPIGSGDTKLKMYEASKGTSEVKGLEEMMVRSKEEVYQILAQGQERRRIASTLMNAQSSRSHTVFTIVVRMNMKEPTADGEEIVKTGKLNLVDLAGSENISKAGSDNPGKGDRKRECVVINQSLLTLGRVITALVERHPHIPYRESKLTRLLQESLGGRTKTSIIATISPGHKDQEETLSTLEYAHRARNIQNRPEVNQRVLKTQMMCEMVEDLDRLKRDLYATREQKGVYYSPESHAELQLQLASQKKEIQDQILQIKSMKEEAERLDGELKGKMQGLRDAEERLGEMERAFEKTQDDLDYVKSSLSEVSQRYEEQRHLVGKLGETEARLGGEARQVREAADTASAHVACLHRTVAKRRKLEEANMAATRSYGAEAGGRRARLRERLDTATDHLGRELAGVSQALETHLSECLSRQRENEQQLDSLVQQLGSAIAEVTSTVESTQADLTEKSRQHRETMQTKLRQRSDGTAARLRDAAARLAACLEGARRREREAVEEIRGTAERWRSSTSERLQQLEAQHEGWYERWGELERGAERRARAEAQRRREHARTVGLALMTEQQEMQQAKERLQQEIDRIMTRNQNFYTSMIETVDNDAAVTTREDDGLQAERGAARELIGSYRESLVAGLGGIGKEVDELGRKVVEKVTETHENAYAELDKTRIAVEGEMTAAAESERQSNDILSRETTSLLADSLESTERVLTTTLSHVQKYNETSTAGVTALCSSVSERWSADASLSQRLAGDVMTAVVELSAMRDDLRSELLAQDGLQDVFLNNEYKSYSPTGKTPARMEYRYPRTFTATSPHERILARFREQRAHSDDDCIVLDDMREASQASEAAVDANSSSLSTDSAVVFLEPSPPNDTPTGKLTDASLGKLAAGTPTGKLPVGTPTGKLLPLHKSTSETDLYSKKKNQKENQNQNLSSASSLQKLSKLRQPSSHKKVLTQKN